MLVFESSQSTHLIMVPSTQSEQNILFYLHAIELCGIFG